MNSISCVLINRTEDTDSQNIDANRVDGYDAQGFKHGTQNAA